MFNFTSLNFLLHMRQTSSSVGGGGGGVMHRNASQQRQTRSLDNIVENPDSWRFHDKINSNVLFINQENNTNSSTNGTSSSNNKQQKQQQSSRNGEAIEMWV